jgi:hypothetical protein
MNKVYLFVTLFDGEVAVLGPFSSESEASGKWFAEKSRAKFNNYRNTNLIMFGHEYVREVWW